MIHLPAYTLDREGNPVGRPIFVPVPEGYWVAKPISWWNPYGPRRSFTCEDEFRILGAKPQWVNRYITELTKNEVFGWCYTYALVCSRPFGLLVEDTLREDNQYFITAKRATGGQLKGIPKSKRPSYVRGTQRWRWAKLADLATILKMDAEQLWRFYFHVVLGLSFTRDYEEEWYSSQHVDEDFPEVPFPGKPGLPVILDNPTGPIVEYDADMNPQTEVSEVCRDPGRMWIPAGFATRVCLMHRFGYRPRRRGQLRRS